MAWSVRVTLVGLLKLSADCIALQCAPPSEGVWLCPLTIIKELKRNHYVPALARGTPPPPAPLQPTSASVTLHVVSDVCDSGTYDIGAGAFC